MLMSIDKHEQSK